VTPRSENAIVSALKKEERRGNCERDYAPRELLAVLKSNMGGKGKEHSRRGGDGPQTGKERQLPNENDKGELGFPQREGYWLTLYEELHEKRYLGSSVHSKDFLSRKRSKRLTSTDGLH